MSAEYFPLKENVRYEYKFTSTEFEGEAKVFIDLLKVVKKPGKTTAHARMIFELRDSHTTEYTIVRDAKWLTTADGIIVGGRREFPLPPVKGLKWDQPPDSSEIVSLSGNVSAKAGKFKKCLKVVTLFGGGDAGRSARYYAPGIGYIFEEYTGEDKTCELELAAITVVPDEKKKKSKG